MEAAMTALSYVLDAVRQARLEVENGSAYRSQWIPR